MSTKELDIVGAIIDMENGEATEEDTIATMQAMIDSGQVWHMQGSYGRMASDMLEAGLCHLPSIWSDGKNRKLTKANMAKYAHLMKQPIRDYWGNLVPYREMLEDGTKGTLAYCQRMQENN